MSYVMAEYLCPTCGRVESLETRPAPKWITHDCGSKAEACISATHFKTCYATVTRGKSDPPPSPMALNTEPLASGMKRSEFRKKRREMWRDHDRRVKAQKYG